MSARAIVPKVDRKLPSLHDVKWDDVPMPWPDDYFGIEVHSASTLNERAQPRCARRVDPHAPCS